ncbi:piggyBac transposable element-derived protein 4-like [Anthonomus grandis grandis]|uniref:piggyBac transposable element-derived protein 4-like n=1 Tax=Anthonomus grandis grandis TaxID=2921223 RepID=UPI0021652F8F|nr:piggyBac transposable element-derived protein 4-like [Anthonomus grandis grandis]
MNHRMMFYGSWFMIQGRSTDVLVGEAKTCPQLLVSEIIMSKNDLTDRELEEILARSDSEYDEIDEPMELDNEDNWPDDDIIITPAEENNIEEFFSNRTNLVESSEDSDSSSDQPVHAAAFQSERSFLWTTKAFDPKVHPALKYFEFFFTQELVEQIAAETNKYYDYLLLQDQSEHSRIKRWRPVEYKEMYSYFAVALLMPHVKKNKLNYYWSNDEFIKTPIFSRLMKRDRLLLITKLLHFTDNNGPLPEEKDSLQKVRARVFFRQYMPSKRHRFGVNFFLLCDTDTGDILDFIVYTGASTNVKEFDGADIGKSGSIVMTLLESYLEKGHTLFVDNWYTSPNLFESLYKSKTTACEKLQKGEFTYRSTENLLAVRWQDKREVNMLSSCHKPDVEETGKTDHQTGRRIMKPSCIVNYNQHMGPVDKSDMLLSSVECVRKSMKWYKN